MLCGDLPQYAQRIRPVKANLWSGFTAFWRGLLVLSMGLQVLSIISWARVNSASLSMGV